MEKKYPIGEVRVYFVFKHPKTGEEMSSKLYTPLELLDTDLSIINERTCVCDCQPVGETNVVECNCEDYYQDFVFHSYHVELVRAPANVEQATPQGIGWVKGQYDRLFDQLKAEPERKIVCWVDYIWRYRDEREETLRDICAIMGKVMGFNARGIGYGGCEIWIGEENEKQEFLKECARLNVQWLDESAGEKEVKPEMDKPKYYTDEELRDIISMVCDQLNEGFNGREEFIDQTIAVFAGKKAAIEELRKLGVKHPNPHLCDNRNNCGYPGCECLPF